MLDRFKIAICCTYWCWLPAPIWAITASPLLVWAGIGDRYINWPCGRSTSPFDRSFWYVPRWDYGRD